MNASNINYGSDSYTFEDEEWSETIFLAVAIGILVLVIIIAISAVIFVITSNWRLKYYSTFHTYNNDNNSSIESSLKRSENLLKKIQVKKLILFSEEKSWFSQTFTVFT